MKMSLDCIPCFVRQALDAARMASDDQDVHAKILNEVLHWACNIDLQQPSPLIGQRIHRRLRQVVGIDDPYRPAKDHQNQMALKMLPELQEKIRTAADPFDMAVKLAIAGNVIDLGVPGVIDESKITEGIRDCLSEPLSGNSEELKKAAANARKILYLADNAGEIAFDRLLVEQLGPSRVIVVVRGGPAINDATMPDAHAVGMHKITQVIDNGSDAPGTLLQDCSPSFLQHFKEADLIIAKGQGNYETLSDEPYSIFFLFKAKCKVVAEHAQVSLGSHVIVNKQMKTAFMQ